LVIDTGALKNSLRVNLGRACLSLANTVMKLNAVMEAKPIMMQFGYG
jgi:hypothetical protein